MSKVKVLSQPIYGRIMNYRIGIRTQYSRQCQIKFNGIDSTAQAGFLMGQKVVWKGANKRIIGKIVVFHRKRGVVRAKFAKGAPGQALGTTVELIR